METSLNNKILNVNHTNMLKIQNKPNNKMNKKNKSNEILNKIPEMNHHQKLYNRNLIIANKINSKQKVNNNNNGKNFKNYINNIKNIYNKTSNNSYNKNKTMKINNIIKNGNENKKIIIKSNNNTNNTNDANNKINLMNFLIKKKNNNTFNFNNINKLTYTKSMNNKISNVSKNDKNNNNNNKKVLPGIKNNNNKKSIDNTSKTNKLINAFTPNIILNDINNKTYNNKNFTFNIINKNLKENSINQQIPTSTTNTNTITEYPNINNKINLNNIINLSSKDDSDIKINLLYKKNINHNKIYEIIETDKVTINYDKKTGNKIVNEFYFLDTIGRGAYSKVKKCINLNTREEFAVKILNKRLLRKKKKSYGKTKEGTLKINYMIEDAINEINIYKSFPEGNDNVIRLYQILNDNKKDKTYLIMELAQKGPLVTLNEKTGVFCLNKNYRDDIYDEQLMKKWILDIA